jgi:DNA modification methylase
MNRYELIHADCRAVMANMGDDSVDSIVTDPPYHLTSIVKRFGPGCAPQQHGTNGAYARAARGFMGQTWDGGDIAFDVELWREALRVLKPGGHLVAFSGTRTYHRMACAIEDAGFEIRDMLEWLYGSGFPKGGLDDEGRAAALKPAHEPICLARKPFRGSAAGCVETYGTGLLNIDACRIGLGGGTAKASFPREKSAGVYGDGINGNCGILDLGKGRFPANVAHDGSSCIVEQFPAQAGAAAPVRGTEPSIPAKGDVVYGFRSRVAATHHGDTGSAARFYFEASDEAEDICARANIAAVRFDLQSQLDAFVQRLAATADNPGGRQLRFTPIQHSMSATASELSEIYETLMQAMVISENALWHEPPRAGLSLSRSNARIAAQRTPTGITTTITDLTISSGSVGPVIFDITLPNLEVGAPGCEQSTARFMYCAKASKRDRGEGNTHPTVKPTDIMRWIVRLATPAGGVVFDPFTGSGSTGKAAMLEGLRFIGAEMTAEYIPIARARIDAAVNSQ